MVLVTIISYALVSIVLAAVLKLIPVLVLFGVFLYMGIASSTVWLFG